MIWFGIFLVIVVEMAQITPPVGFNLFVLQGMANKDMGYIARSAFPAVFINGLSCDTSCNVSRDCFMDARTNG